jgi:hypothetical protein
MSQTASAKERVSRKVLQKINDEQVKMRPSCIFLATSWLWLLVSGFLFFLAVAFFSVTIRYIDFAEPTVLLFKKPLLLLSALPYFFIILGVLLLIFAALSYRRSRSCCRHEDWMLVGMLFFGAFVIGISVYDAHLEDNFVERMEESERMNAFVKTPVEFWYQPSRGTLSGVVATRLDDQVIELKGWDGVIWVVYISENGDQEFIKRKMPIKMIGHKQEEEDLSFVAQEVFGW